MRNFEAMNEAYLGVFEDPQPVSRVGDDLLLFPFWHRNAKTELIYHGEHDRRGRVCRLWAYRFRHWLRWSVMRCFDGCGYFE